MNTLTASTQLLSALVLSLAVSAVPTAIAQTTSAPAAIETPPPAPGGTAKREKVVDPDLLLHVGVTGGRVRGAAFVDATGKAKGRIVGNPMKTTLGPGEGLRFNGTSDWLEVSEDSARSPGCLPGREFTVSAWVSIAKTTRYGGIIGYAQDNGDAESGWMLGYTDDAFYFALATQGADDGDGKLTYLKGGSRIEPGRWYHVAGVYDGRTMRLFVNGQPDGETNEQSGDILYPSRATYSIACYKDDDEQFPMDGTLLEVKVLGRAQSQQQVTEEFVPGVRLTSYQPEQEATQRFVVKPYLQFATTDSITVMWETSRPGRSVVEYGEELPYSQRTSESSIGNLHEIRITGLSAQTPYFYRARTISEDGVELVGDALTFQTAVLPGTPFSFAILGDTQKNKPVIEKLQSFAFSLRPNFEIHLGDVVDKGPDKSEWVEELLPASWPLMSRVCMYPAIGNHEENHSNYYQYFSLPSPECWYTYTYGNAQFFVVDTNKPVGPGSEQYDWLDRALAESAATWKFVYHHHPVYSSDEDDYGDTYKGKSTFGNPGIRMLAPLLEKHGVDIDFCGHIHSYERTWPIFEGKVDEERGVRYIVAGGGGGGLESAGPSRAWFTQRVYRGHHLCQIMIHGKTLQFQAFDLEGRLFDTMDIRKK